MSMEEALRPLRGNVDWLKPGAEELPEPPKAPTPLEDAATLVDLAARAGMIDRQSPTWNGVARWAASELLEARSALEVADDEQSKALRARCATLRDLLALNERSSVPDKIEDSGPEIP